MSIFGNYLTLQNADHEGQGHWEGQGQTPDRKCRALLTLTTVYKHQLNIFSVKQDMVVKHHVPLPPPS